ncbi:hypothetical protein BU25DRAFT_456665 [Macroventuria anomochaeta]|uniref:Uncharacterized protein n=1 Tax=Macroventuria anomochaeta TaxID=301207 RepID=A0ACB6S8A5_9PLEO|nr:uncharacterized protein BU25DRAFT_456665 [Macroventuria anomochaeta]KAF2629579.1 hypothetical protein BU25DRAFT_456665 [Macroventuria anomochaeta]
MEATIETIPPPPEQDAYSNLILFPAKATELNELGTVICHSHIRSRRYESSAIPDSHYAILYSDITLPAQELGLSAVYALQWLKDYVYHNNHPARRTQELPDQHCHTNHSRYKHTFSQHKLGAHLVAGDLYIERITPNEVTRLLIATAIAKFNEKHWKERPTTRIERRWWVDDAACIALAESVDKVAKAKERSVV